jgi:hypothetical protein
MLVTAGPEAPAAIRVDLGAIFVSLELSKSTWLITSLSPGGGGKMSRHAVAGGDIAGLFARFGELRERAQARTGKRYPLVVIQEAVSTASGSIGGCARKTGSKAMSLMPPRSWYRADGAG